MKGYLSHTVKYTDFQFFYKNLRITSPGNLTKNFSRTFYVGDDVEEDDIKAKFEDGVLKIAVPKKQEQPKLEEKKTISIEG